MSEDSNSSSMPSSDWRLWCCCRPEIEPPRSFPRVRDDISMEEFDPRNRLSMSRAYGPQTPPPPPTPPGTPTESHTSTPSTLAARFAKTRTRKPNRQQPSERSKPKERAKPRPTTVLLPDPPGPERPPSTQDSAAKVKQSKAPQYIRQDSEAGERWWQVGKRLFDRKDSEGSLQRARQEQRDRK